MRLADATWGLLDVETSGLEEGDDLLEVAVHLYRGLGDYDDRFVSLVAPTKPIPPQASGVHGLIDEDFIGAPSRLEVEKRLESFLPDGTIFVAHNAEFDLRVMGWGSCPHVCSKRLAHHMTPEAPDFHLQTLRYYYGFKRLDVGQAHRAEADVITLGAVFFHLLGLYRKWAADLCGDDQERFEKADTVEALIATVNRPYIMPTWPAGPPEAKGKPFSELDLGLLRWGLGKFDGDFRWNIERELKRRAGAA